MQDGFKMFGVLWTLCDGAFVDLVQCRGVGKQRNVNYNVDVSEIGF